MTKKELDELSGYSRLLINLEKEKSDLPMLQDITKGSSPNHPYTTRTIKIEGVDTESLIKIKDEIRLVKNEMEPLMKKLENDLNKLDKKESRTRRIIRMYAAGMTHLEIANHLGVSRGRITQIINSASFLN